MNAENAKATDSKENSTPESSPIKSFVLNADCFLVKNAPQNIRYIPNFITKEEEQMLLSRIYSVPRPKWTTLKHRRLQSWGGLVGVNGLVSDGKMPDWLNLMIDRIMTVQNGFSTELRPNHVLINEYLPGQGILPHTDGSAFTPLISTISLGSSTMLDFYTPLIEGEAQTDLKSRYVGSMLLQSRSLVFVKDFAYSLLHGISENPVDIVTEKVFNRPKNLKIGTDIPRQTRLSLTIRNVPQTKTMNVASLLQQR